MATKAFKSEDTAFADLYNKHPKFDILHFDLNDERSVKKLKLSKARMAELMPALRVHQRLSRIEYLCNYHQNGKSIKGVASKLRKAGFTSAHSVARLPEHRFVREQAQLFNNDEEKAKRVHQAAKSITAHTQHILANVHNAVASPHYRSMRTGQGSAEIENYFVKLPGYQDLFGSLNYLGGDQCNSIFSPAAYFLDLMRIIEDYISDDPLNTIQPAYKLSARRPDLFELELTCSNSFDLVPYLDIVNEVIERRISDTLKNLIPPNQKRAIRKSAVKKTKVTTDIVYEPWQSIAIAKYPFNLPFHLPLSAIRQYAGNLKVTLAEVFKSFNIPVNTGNVISATNNTIKLSSTASTDANAYVSMQVVITAGLGIGQSRNIISYPATLQTATIDRNWDIIPDIHSQYHIVNSIDHNRESLGLSVELYNLLITPQPTDEGLAPYYGVTTIDLTAISKVETFLSATGLEWNELQDLLVQGLSNKEIEDKIADNFYINDTNEPEAMAIYADKKDPTNPVFRISNISLLRLDRLNRFIRLSKQLKWSYSLLNTALVSLIPKGGDITPQTIQSLARIEFLRLKSGFEIDELCSFWSDMKTTGKGNGTYPADLFDRVFNNPGLLHGQDPYSPNSTTPFNSQMTITWAFENSSGQDGIVRSRLCAALFINDNDLLSLARKYYKISSGTGNSISLNISSLSWFYRITKAASFLKLKIDPFITLLQLIAGGAPKSAPVASALLLTIEEVIWLWNQTQGASQLPFSPYEMDYLINKTLSPYYKPPYSNEEIVTLLQNMWTAAAVTRLKVDNFSFGNASPDRSKILFEALVKNEFINANGICLNDIDEFTVASTQFPLSVKDFTIGNITGPEATDVFEQLHLSHPPILEASGSDWILSESYSARSNLDFLFPNDPEGTNKRNLVRSVLNDFNDKIAIQEFSFLFPFTENSFVNDTITAAESSTVFRLLKINPTGSNWTILLPSGSDGLLSANFDAETPLDFLFTAKNNSIEKKKTGTKKKKNLSVEMLPLTDGDVVLKRNMVRDILLARKRDMIYVAEVMSRYEDLQDQTIISGLAGFLQTTPEYVTAMLPFILGQSSMDDFRKLLLAPLEDEQTDPCIYEFISIAARTCIIFSKLAYEPNEIAAVVNVPDAFEIELTQTFSYYNIGCLASFKNLQKELNDKGDTLVTCFYMPNTTEGDKATANLLAGLTGWKADQLIDLSHILQEELTCVHSFKLMADCFRLSEMMQISVTGLLQLTKVGQLPLFDKDGKFDGNNWASYCDQWKYMQGAMSVAASNEFDTLNAGSIAALNTMKRDALLWYAIWLLNSKGVAMQTPDDLYQYLLIDVQMGGCDSISLMAQAISSVQLYLQRCRLMLEDGVNGLTKIPDAWWKWMSSYRTWEANRKIFLYPENYIDPALRKDTSPLFGKMVEELMQTNIDDNTIAEIYKNYFTGLTDLAALSPCNSYQCMRTVPGINDPVKTLFVFARTQKQPYVYYYRWLDDQSGWTPWTKIDLVINSTIISPVYAFNRLFIFWAEPKIIDTSTMKNNDSLPQSTYSTTFKYSFLDNQQNWVQPQEIVSDLVTCFTENYAYDGNVTKALGILKIAFGQQQAQWQELYAVSVPASAFVDTNIQPNGEGIMLLYGPRVIVSKTSDYIDKPKIASEQIPAAQHTFDQSIINLVEVYSALRDLPDANSKSIPVVSPLFIDSSLNLQQIPSYYPNNQPGQNSTSYRAALVREANLLVAGLISSSNVIDENYFTDDFARNTDNERFIGGYAILANISGANASIISVKNRPYQFILDNGDQAFLVDFGDSELPAISDHLNITPADALTGDKYSINSTANYATIEAKDLTYKFTRLNTTVVRQLYTNLINGGLNSLLSITSQKTSESPFGLLKPVAAHITEPAATLDFDGAYGLYFWETFFHAPFLVASTLCVNKRNADAQRWYQYIFNPTQQTSKDETGNERFWRFLPFRTMNIEDLTEILTNPWQIAAYNNKPFDPDAIARLRTSAYAKTIVMHYIDNLIAWADQLYEQDTRESITEAVNLYVMASNLLGKRPQQVGEFKATHSKNFNEIKEEYNNKDVLTGTATDITEYTITLDNGASTEDDAYDGMRITINVVGVLIENYIVKYDGLKRKVTVADKWNAGAKKDPTYRIYVDGIPEFLVRLENTPPALQLINKAAQVNADMPFNDINSYFTIPENRDFIGYWDKVEDRLYKIRNCMNKQGVVRQMALYEPPIDPRMAGALADRETKAGGQTQVPAYRFAVMIEKAKSFTSNVMNLGGSLLSILEKKDAETLGLLRATQETTMLNLMTFIKEQQVEDLIKQKASLNESLNNARIRYNYYTQLVAKGLSEKELANIISSKIGLTFSVASEAIKTISAIGYSLPQFGSPFAMTYGGMQVGASLAGFAGVLDIGSMIANFNAQMSLTMASYSRREAEWNHMAALASADMAQIQFQIQSNEISQAMSNRDLENHLVAIRQSNEMELFLENKFTNEQLYQWLLTKMSGIYFQTYTLAYDLALSAQNAFQFEMNVNNAFVSYGYWSNLQKGLGAGESLMLALNQMEKSFIDNNTRALEIQKTISLSQLNPLSLLQLIQKGECIFDLPEKLFDDDFPGHFARKIKTISISIPVVVGPYQNIKASLTQLSSQVILKPNENVVDYLLGGNNTTMPDTGELRSNWLVNQQIAISTGSNDNGMFELRFDDDRYLPFEGTGAVSQWKLSMPMASNRIDFNNITDVVIQLKYKAIDGGSDFRRKVLDLELMKVYTGSRYFDLASMFSGNWFEFLNVHPDPVTQSLKFQLTGLEPLHVEDCNLTAIYFEIDLTKDVEKGANKQFISLVLPTGKIVPLELDADGKRYQPIEDKINLKDLDGEYLIAFNLNDTPLEWKTGGYLNGEIIKDIKIVIFYAGQLVWK